MLTGISKIVRGVLRVFPFGLGVANFFSYGTVYILSFASPKGPVATQLCHCGEKAAVDNTYTNVYGDLYSRLQGGFGPRAIVPAPDLEDNPEYTHTRAHECSTLYR